VSYANPILKLVLLRAPAGIAIVSVFQRLVAGPVPGVELDEVNVELQSE
jgi:hypothetical protein